MTKASKKTNFKAPGGSELQRIPYTNYSAQFDEFLVKALIKSNDKLNAMQSSFVIKVRLQISQMNVGDH